MWYDDIIQIGDHNKEILCSSLSDKGKEFVDWLINNFTIIHSDRISYYSHMSCDIMMNNMISSSVKGNILHINHIIENDGDVKINRVYINESDQKAIRIILRDKKFNYLLNEVYI